MNIFDCAIKIQEETKEYYEGLKVVSKNPQMKTLFSILAASNAEHRNNLLRLKSSIEPERAQVQPLDGTACSFRPLLTERELLEKAENDPDLYQFTVREEEQEIHFYEELASLTADDATGSTLLMLAEEERRHLETVENIYAFVEEPETYLEWGEFSNRKEL
jgi:rubrerythrin